METEWIQWLPGDGDQEGIRVTAGGCWISSGGDRSILKLDDDIHDKYTEYH